MPKSVQRCSTNMSHSSKVPSSSSSSSRSRAVSLPFLCCAAMRLSPPPRRAAARFFSSCSRMSCMLVLGFFSVSVRLLHGQQQLARGGGCRDAPLFHVLGHVREQRLHVRVIPEHLLQAA